MKQMFQWFKNIILGEVNSEFYYQAEQQRYESQIENHKVSFFTSNKAS